MDSLANNPKCRMKQIKSFRITEANAKALAKLAKAEKRSEGWIINIALQVLRGLYP